MAVASAAVLSFSITVSASASVPTGTPDTQEAAPPANSLNFQAMTAMAQVFTPAHSGDLTDVTLYVGTAGSNPITVYLNIWDTTSKDPTTASPLQQCLMDATNPRTTRLANQLLGTNTWHNFTLTKPVWVTADTPYAIVVCAPFANVFRWSWENVETYPGGKPYLWSGGWMTPSGFKAFDFKAWVSGSQTLSLTPNNAAVTVTEGAAGANTGTFSNPFGYAVSLSASAGSVTKSGTSTGTWSWTAPDEGPSQTVMITADDGHSHTATASFTATVNAVKPTVQITSGAGQVASSTVKSPEGTPIQLTGWAHSPSADDNASGFTYMWMVSKDGADFAAGFGSSWSFTPDDEGTYVVTLIATDDGGYSNSSVPMTFIGTNLAPTATIIGVTGPAPWNLFLPQEQLMFTGSFTDPGTGDTHTATWDFGDGATTSTRYDIPSGSEKFSVTHSYVNPGTYPVSLTVADDDGGTSTAHWTVNVVTTQQALATIAAQVQKLPNLTAGERNSLTVKLNAASAAISRGDTTAANNQLNAFLHELQAYVNTGKVSESDATQMRSAIHAIKASLGTLSRFLES